MLLLISIKKIKDEYDMINFVTYGNVVGIIRKR